MLKALLTLHQPLTPSQIADLRRAASKMTGAKRRAFEAEMALKYCAGNPLTGRKHLWLEPSDGCVRPRRKAHWHPVSRCASGLQWSQTLGRHATRGR